MQSVMVHLLKWAVGCASPETQTTAGERACLARHAAGRRRLAEIGVWHGVTTRLLLREMAPEGVYFAVDPYPVGRLGFSAQMLIAHRGVSRVHSRRVIWLRVTGGEAAADPRVREYPIDFLFIDGDHRYEALREDWEAWSGLIAPDGVVALHDSRPTPGRPIGDAGSVRYTNEVVLRDPRFALDDSVDTLSVFRRLS
jgi:predicted O-methyltransferase YrrM